MTFWFSLQTSGWGARSPSPSIVRELTIDVLQHSRDQLCSLAFPLGNIYFVACSYARGFQSPSFQKCSKPSLWAVPLLLSTLPLVARFGQSIRRWWDSGLITHLINVRLLPLNREPLKLGTFNIQGGKYLTGIVYYFCYYLWRHNGENSPSGRPCRQI